MASVRLQLYVVAMSQSSRIQEVDNYIDQLPPWQQDICNMIRGLIHDAEPEIAEVIKRRVRPYFVLEGNVAALLAAKKHVNVFIYDPIADDPGGIINQGHDNATARAIQITQSDSIDEDAFKQLIRNVVANNRAGGWRNVQRRSR